MNVQRDLEDRLAAAQADLAEARWFDADACPAIEAEIRELERRLRAWRAPVLR